MSHTSTLGYPGLGESATTLLGADRQLLLAPLKAEICAMAAATGLDDFNAALRLLAGCGGVPRTALERELILAALAELQDSREIPAV